MYTKKDKAIWNSLCRPLVGSGRPLLDITNACRMLASGYWWCCIYINKYTYDSARPREYGYLVPTVDKYSVTLMSRMANKLRQQQRHATSSY